MDKRSAFSIGILLLFIFTVSCHKIESKDSIKKEDNEVVIEAVDLDRIDEEDVDVMQEGKADRDDFLYNTDHEEKFDIEESIDSEEIIDKKEKTETQADSEISIATKYDIHTLLAGSILEEDTLDTVNIETMFSINELTDGIIERIVGKSYGENCTVPFSELRYIRVLHKDFEGKTRIGELIVHRKIAEDIVEIFKELYEKEYPIEKMLLIDEFDADDNASMKENNSSAFNFRFIDGTKRLSLHSYGMAIDINPLYNPYVRVINGETVVIPEEGIEHMDRTVASPYYIKKGDSCYEAFIRRGFTWGGDWNTKKDYQHFEKNQGTKE